jgi:zinc transporter 2
MTFFLLGEAVKRCFMPNIVDSNLMLPVAILGLVFNLIQIKILHGNHDHGHAGHDHGHDHGHGHSHDHKQEKKIADPTVKESLLTNHDAHEHSHDHDHAHDHAHDHGHGHSHGGHSHENMGLSAAYLHVLGDLIMSIGVILAATVIWFFPTLWWFDPLCTFIFSIMIVFTSLPTIKKCLHVIMEGVPDSINTASLKQDIYACVA